MNLRLYRALPNGETKITSKKVIKNNAIDLTSVELLDEAYTHICKSHLLNKEPIFTSFTDDYLVAKKFTEKFPDVYKAIGYVDITCNATNNAFNIDHDRVLFMKSIYTPDDWVDLASYKYKDAQYLQEVSVRNVVYNRVVPLINTLIPSHWGVLSLARTAREYILITNELELKIIDEKQNIKTNVTKVEFECCNSKKIKNTITNILLRDLYSLEVKRKKYIESELNALSKVYEYGI